MKIILAAVLATVIAVPCMAKDSDEDRGPSDVQVPGKTEPLVPDTLKSAPDKRIQSEGRASEREGTVGERSRPGAPEPEFNEKRNEDKK
jgi:hypothetical protein